METDEPRHTHPLLDSTDRLSHLPAEVLTDIFSYLAPDPPLALSKKLLPFSRATRLARVEVTSFKQLKHFVATLQASPTLGTYVRSFAIALREPTETLLALDTAFNDTLVDALVLLPTVKTVEAVDWMTSSFILSDNAVSALGANVDTLRLTILLTQLNSEDFVTYRLVLLARFLRLRKVEILVLPFDPGSSSATAFDLFPASDLAPPPLDMTLVTQIEQLVVVGAMCDQRVVNILRAFRGVRDVALFDSFASRHIAPALAALDPSGLKGLVLQRSVEAPPPVDLSPQETDWLRFAGVHELFFGIPVASPETFLDALPGFANLSRVVFGSGSEPSAALVRHLLTHRPPALREIVLSHVTGEVGLPLSPTSLPSVALWLQAVRAVSQDSAASHGDDPSAPTVTPIFPLLDWRLPRWTPDFDRPDAEALFPLARSAGVALRGTLLSACLTSYVLERQMDLWFEDSQGAIADLGDDEREVICQKPFWDALALRYAGRLLEEDERGQDVDTSDHMDYS